MMQPPVIERLREGYEDKYVTVENGREELARFQGLVGRVCAVNCNGRALVEFQNGEDRARYDIEIDLLRVTDKPGAKSAANGSSLTAKTEPPLPTKLSSLELARLEKQS